MKREHQNDKGEKLENADAVSCAATKGAAREGHPKSRRKKVRPAHRILPARPLSVRERGPGYRRGGL